VLAFVWNANHVYKSINFKSILLAPVVCLPSCSFPSMLYALSSLDSLDFETYCCVIFPSSSVSLHTFWGMVYVNQNVVGFDFCCAAACQWNIAYRLVGLHQGVCPVCFRIIYLHRSRSASRGSAFCVHVPVQFAARQALSSTLPTSPFWLVQVYPRVLFRRLHFIFHPPLGVPKDHIPSTTMGLMFWAVDIMIH
jgi:hypothetical protein